MQSRPTLSLLRTASFILLPLLALSTFGLVSCQDDCKTTITYKSYEPVYMLRDDLRKAVASLPAKTLDNPGKIYVKGNYLFINEVNEGIQVFNNTNPASPQPISFINIPGNQDMAVRDNILYADSFIDLIALDISDPNAIKLLKRVENVFPSYGYDNSASILVDYKEKWVTQETDGDCSGRSNVYANLELDGGVYYDKAFLNNSAASAPGGKPGIGGSMARFTIYDRYLYTVSQSDMQLFDITAPADPKQSSKINLGWNIETIFPYQDKLFIGSQTGMQIYDNHNPSSPELLSTFSHVKSCDPVVVEGNYAYVTLRTGNTCQGNVNELDVVDISNLRAPSLVKSYPMENPHGLGVDNETLFLCEGESGLKVFNVKDALTIDQHLLQQIKDLDAYDVIPLGKILLVVGKNGLYQYDYSDPKSLKLLSVIPVARS